MSTVDNLYPEQSITNAQFRTLLAGYRKRGIRPNIVQLGVFSDGARYHVVDQYRDSQFYLVTDLTGPSVFSATSGTQFAAATKITGVRLMANNPQSTVIGTVLIGGPAIAVSQSTIPWVTGGGRTQGDSAARTDYQNTLVMKDASGNLRPIPSISSFLATDGAIPVAIDGAVSTALPVSPGGGTFPVSLASLPNGQMGLGTGDSIQAGNRVAGPAAGANISGNIIAAAKAYLVFCTLNVDGTVAVATDDANMGLYQNAVKLTTLAYDASNLASVYFGPFRITAALNDTFSVRAIANATATANYMATVWAIPQT